MTEMNRPMYDTVRARDLFRMVYANLNAAIVLNQLLNEAIEIEDNPPFGSPAYQYRETIAKARDRSWAAFQEDAAWYMREIFNTSLTDVKWVQMHDEAIVPKGMGTG